MNLKKIVAGVLSLWLFISCFMTVSATDYYHEMKSLYEGAEADISGLRNNEDIARNVLETLEEGVAEYNDGTLDKDSNFGKVVAFYMSCKKSKSMSEKEKREFLEPYCDLIDTIYDKDSALDVIAKLQDELDCTYGATACHIIYVIKVYYSFGCRNVGYSDDGEPYRYITNDDNVTTDVLEGIMDRAFEGQGKYMVSSDSCLQKMCGLFSRENIDDLKSCLKIVTEKGLIDPISKYIFLDSSELPEEQARAKEKEDALNLIYTIKDKESALRVIEELDFLNETGLQELVNFGDAISPKLREWSDEGVNKGELRRFLSEKKGISGEVYDKYDRENDLDKLLADNSIPILKIGLSNIISRSKVIKSLAETDAMIAAQVGPGYYEAILERMLEKKPRVAGEFEKSKEIFEEVKELYIQKIQSSPDFSDETKARIINNLMTNVFYNELKDENWEDYVPESFKLCNADYSADNFLHNIKVNARRFCDLREAMESIPRPIADCIRYYLFPVTNMNDSQFTVKSLITGKAVSRGFNEERSIVFSPCLMSEYIRISDMYASMDNAKCTSEQASEILIANVIAHELGHYIDRLFDTHGVSIGFPGCEQLGIVTEEEKQVVTDKREKLKRYLEEKFDMELIGADEAFADLCACEIMMDYGKEHGIDTGDLFFIISHRDFNEILESGDNLHPSSVARVNGTFSNMDEFYEAMEKDGREITPDDDMYIAPEDRVHIF